MSTSSANVSRKRQYSCALTVNILVVGDANVGKSTLIDSILKQYSNMESNDNFSKSQLLWEVQGSRTYQIELLDTSEQTAESDANRMEAYHNADVVFICFAIDQPKSYENVSQKWIPEFTSFCPYAKAILVGTKVDVRMNGSMGKMKFLEPWQGLNLATEIPVEGYAECSAVTAEKIPQLLDMAVQITEISPISFAGCGSAGKCIIS